MTLLHLASRSPRRRELLEAAGWPFVTLDVDVDESIEGDLDPPAIVRELAQRKATAGMATLSGGGVVLGADTIVAVGSVVLGKPRDRADARRMLHLLSGTEHRVLTGICLLSVPDGRELLDHDTTYVSMRPLTEEEIRDYVASGECDDKAGAYAIQERGDRFVSRIDGSWSNVVGLPMELLSRHLTAWGVNR